MKDLKLSKVIWKERGLATIQVNGIEHTEQTHALLQSIWECREAAFMHCKAQRNGKTTPELNCFAGKIVKGAAKKKHVRSGATKRNQVVKVWPKV